MPKFVHDFGIARRPSKFFKHRAVASPRQRRRIVCERSNRWRAIEDTRDSQIRAMTDMEIAKAKIYWRLLEVKYQPTLVLAVGFEKPKERKIK